MTYHTETLEWLKQIETVAQDAKRICKSRSSFVNTVKRLINKNNEEIDKHNKKVRELFNKISQEENKPNVDKRTINGLKKRYQNLVRNNPDKYYPREFETTDNGEIFCQIYYDK